MRALHVMIFGTDGITIICSAPRAWQATSPSRQRPPAKDDINLSLSPSLSLSFREFCALISILPRVLPPCFLLHIFQRHGVQCEILSPISVKTELNFKMRILGGEFLVGEFLRGLFFLERKEQIIRPQDSAPKLGARKFVPQSSTLTSGSRVAKSLLRRFVSVCFSCLRNLRTCHSGTIAGSLQFL